MKVSIKKELCVGCGLCEENVPKLFRMNGSCAVVRTHEVPLHLTGDVQASAEDCPVEAISIAE